MTPFEIEYLKTQWLLVLGQIVSVFVTGFLTYKIFQLNRKLVENDEAREKSNSYKSKLEVFKAALESPLSAGFQSINNNEVREAGLKLRNIYPSNDHIMLHALQELSIKYSFSMVDAKSALDLFDAKIKNEIK